MPNTTPADQLRREIGLRLAQERVGLKLSQDELAQAVEKSRRTVAAWEAGEQSPDALVLALAAAHGVDVTYVVTGRRGNRLSEPQQLLVSYTTGMDSVAIRGALMAVRGLAAVANSDPGLLDPPGTHTPSPAYNSSMTFNGPVDQAAGRDINNDEVSFRRPKKAAPKPP